MVKWKPWGIEWEADPKHRQLLVERFGYGVSTKPLNFHGDNATHQEEEKENCPAKSPRSYGVQERC